MQPGGSIVDPLPSSSSGLMSGSSSARIPDDRGKRLVLLPDCLSARFMESYAMLFLSAIRVNQE